MRQQSNGTGRFGHWIMARRVCQSLNKRASSCSRTALWNTLVFSYETPHFPNHMTVTHLLLSLWFQSWFIILINLHNPHVWQFPECINHGYESLNIYNFSRALLHAQVTRKRKKGKGSSICVSHICTLAFSTFVTKQCIPTFCLIMCIYFGGVLFTFLKFNKIMRWKSNFKQQNEMWAPKSFIFVQNCPKLHHLLCKIVFTQLSVVFIHGHHNLFSGPKYWW